jgi:hypothetical protein
VSFAFILVPTLCYAGASVMYGLQKNWPLAIVYSGYAWANCGLLWLDKLSK